ncbi:hypothetical protein AB0H34_36570, partial [Saccharopolyspora shandongensis]|uniref:hypothetical protein n=1 Tax=Saccharopolyspora shandongensis TaxID=418495 RepID=UPI0033E09E31
MHHILLVDQRKQITQLDHWWCTLATNQHGVNATNAQVPNRGGGFVGVGDVASVVAVAWIAGVGHTFRASARRGRR